MTTELWIPLTGTQHRLFAKEVSKSSTITKNNRVAIVTHGGPGLSDHTELFAGLSNLPTMSKILFWDQFGCGKSVPKEQTETEDKQQPFWLTLEGHVWQLNQVIDFAYQRYSKEDDLSLQICLLGHSWGGQILLEWWASRVLNPTYHPSCQFVAIVSNAPLDETNYQTHQQQLRLALDDPILQAFYDQQDQELAKQDTMGANIYQRLIGISETQITGSMKGWSIWKNSILWKSLQQSVAATNIPPLLLVVTRNDTVPWQDYQRLQNDLREYKTSVAKSSNEPPAFNGPHIVILERGEHAPFFGESSMSYFAEIQSFLDAHNVSKDKTSS